jgi:hypothetical protein
MKAGGRKQYEVRAWQPGDGVNCSSSRAAKSICEKPVATVEQEFQPGPNKAKTVKREVLCALHLGNRFGTMSSQQVVYDAAKVARESLVVAHWDEYQGYLAKAMKEARAVQLELCPDWAKDMISAAMERSDGQDPS